MTLMELVGLIFAGQTPLFNSTAQVYQIVIGILGLLIQFFSMCALWYIAVTVVNFTRESTMANKKDLAAWERRRKAAAAAGTSEEDKGK